MSIYLLKYIMSLYLGTAESPCHLDIFSLSCHLLVNLKKNYSLFIFNIYKILKDFNSDINISINPYFSL